MSFPDPSFRIARNAMATRFELIIEGIPSAQLRAAAEEALDEIDRLESLLSFFRESSEISRINRDAYRDWVEVSPLIFSLILQAREWSKLTHGAFDITIAPLLRLWRTTFQAGILPRPEALQRAKDNSGFEFLLCDPDGCRLRFERPEMSVDLGSIGKGFAIDRAVSILKDLGVESGLIHGGTSTVLSWSSHTHLRTDTIALPGPSTTGVDKVSLSNASLSVSAPWGQGLQVDDRFYGHVIDPRNGEPIHRCHFAAVTASTATLSDALSTALLVAGEDEFQRWIPNFPPIQCLVGTESSLTPSIQAPR